MASRQPSTPPVPVGDRSPAYPKAVEALITEFASLPGIGRRTAERLAFHMLKAPAQEALALAGAIEAVKRTIRHCDRCWSLCDGPLCDLCADPGRDRATVLVVEQPKDLIALEQTGMYRGLYHVLMGRLSPLDDVGPDELTIPSLLDRLDHPDHNPGGVAVREVILGLNPTLEGDGTALHLAEELRARAVAVSRLARGLPSGSQLEYANKAVLADAITGRQKV
ncbi:MAG: recombination protein RecR [Phycisphaerae bacterium]|nr:MAG: recombination protein RecR [Phycisphaerae bacterium]